MLMQQQPRQLECTTAATWFAEKSPDKDFKTWHKPTTLNADTTLAAGHSLLSPRHGKKKRIASIALPALEDAPYVCHGAHNTTPSHEPSRQTGKIARFSYLLCNRTQLTGQVTHKQIAHTSWDLVNRDISRNCQMQHRCIRQIQSSNPTHAQSFATCNQHMIRPSWQ